VLGQIEYAATGKLQWGSQKSSTRTASVPSRHRSSMHDISAPTSFHQARLPAIGASNLQFHQLLRHSRRSLLTGDRLCHIQTDFGADRLITTTQLCKLTCGIKRNQAKRRQSCGSPASHRHLASDLCRWFSGPTCANHPLLTIRMRTPSLSLSQGQVFAMRPCQCQIPTSNGVGAAPLLRRRPVARCTAFRGQPNKQQQRPAPCPCRSSAGDESSTSSDSKVAEKSSGKIATTLAGLDALLGVQEEKQDAEDHKASDVSLNSNLIFIQCARADNQEEVITAHVVWFVAGSQEL